MQGEAIGPVRCVIYAAKSTADERGSIDSQTEACREHAQRQGWDVVEPTYSDEAASAYHGSRGPGLAAAKARAAELAAEGGDVLLLVYATDRLARGDGKKAAHLVEHVLDGLKASYRIESVTENLGGDLALVLASLYGERAHADSKAKSAHTKRGIRQRVEAGLHHGGIAPYGYAVERDRNDLSDRGRLVVIPDEAAIVQRIYAECRAGVGMRAIAARLTADRVATPSAKKPRGSRRVATSWDGSQVANLLGSPLYVGRVHLDGQTFEGQHDAIVDLATWEGVQRLREVKREAHGGGAGRAPAGRHLLAKGMLRCGICGGAMSPRTYHNRRGPDGQALEVYRCLTRNGYHGSDLCSMPQIERSHVDDALLDHFEQVSLDLDATREQLTAAGDRALVEASVRREAAERELMLSNDRIARVRRAFQDGKIDPDDWCQQRLELETEQAAAQAELERSIRREKEVAHEARAIDADAELVTRLASLRNAVAGQIADTANVDALRAAFAAAFSRVDLVVSEDGERDLVPYVRTNPAWIPTEAEAQTLKRAASGEPVEGVLPGNRRVNLELAPNNADTTSALSAGTNALLRLGAAPLTRAADVLESFGLTESEAPAVEGVAAVVLAALRDGPAGADELVRASGLGAGQLAAALAELELAGLVVAEAGRYRAVRPM